MQWCHLLSHWQHVSPCWCNCGIDNHQHHIIPMPNASHNQKSHVAPHFNHLDLMNAAVLLASQDTDMGANCVHDENYAVALHSDHLDLRNAMVPLVILSAPCYAYTRASGVTWQKLLCCTSFLSSWPKEYDGAIDRAAVLVPMASHDQYIHSYVLHIYM